MFDQAFLDGAEKTNKGWTVALSFAFESLAVGLMIVVPLLWTEVLPKTVQANMLTVPAPPPPPAPIPVQPAVKIAPRPLSAGILEAPRVIPTQAAILDDSPAPPSDSVPGRLDASGILNGIEMGGPGIGQAPALSPPPAPSGKDPGNAAADTPETPLRQSSGVQAARCVR